MANERPFWIGVVALLMGLVVILAVIVGPVFFKQRTICHVSLPCKMRDELMVCLHLYHADFGAYPPDDITAAGGSAENASGEALVHYLGQVQRKEGHAFGPYMEFSEDRLTDSDEDGFKEFRDPWGGPWLYAQRPPSPDAAEADATSRGYDIASPGPDGLLGGQMVPGKGYVPATTPEGKAAEADNVTSW